ncbi:multidrug effflux MFS transporter [Paraburkholderia ferrariae]|uniref:multidrug effflux MFS transporter n=1 Tax=Paraburkholderia ferrariae TaxID=386056 RepID=UPI0005A91640|nr:multidrug effflux MFS transporter [Paraburkholderia ferrariae]
MNPSLLKPDSIVFAVFLGTLAALPPISIDMALPALVDIGDTLHATSSQAGFTLSLFMAGFVIGPLGYGPLSDAYGRKPMLLLGLSMFTAGGLLAALAPTIDALLFARFAQGLGAGAGMTMALAIVRDLFKGVPMQRRIASITVVANVAPVLAPSIGVALLAAVHWRGIYAVMAACGLLCTLATWTQLQESSRTARSTFSLARLCRDYATVLRNRPITVHILLNGLGFGWMFAYVAGSPLVFLALMHVSSPAYAAIFATTGSGIVAGATINGFLARHGVSSARLLMLAVTLAALAGAGLIVLETLGRVSVATVLPLLVASTFCFGLAAPSAARGALEPLPQLAGAAGGLLTSVQMLFGAASSSLVAILFPKLGLLGMTGVMTACAVAALAVLLANNGAARHSH